MRRPIAHRRPPAEPTRREGGYTMAMTAILLVPMMLMAALAVDVGSWYVEAQQIQRAADAAALAGVPFMPDHFSDAQDMAREIAAKNGYANGTNDITVTAAPVAGNRRRLKVTITNPHVRTFFGSIVTKEISITRSATAEYVLPVPLGSPRNYIGTGTQVQTQGVFSPEYLWASINGYCSSEIQGDQRASAFFNLSTGANCTGTPNDDYTSTNYQYSIELPTSRTYSTDVIIYDGNFTSGSVAQDQDAGGSSSDMNTTFTLYQPDETPLDDFDNPQVAGSPDPARGLPDVVCSSLGAGHQGTKTFNANTTDDGYSFNPGSSIFAGSTHWWQLCRIPSNAPGGRYILGVTNQSGTALEKTQGTNNFSIVATPSSPQRICDARSDLTCPKVYANESLSVFAKSGSQTANFFLSEIGPEHKGKQVVITLWDASEGGKTLMIRKPTGTNTWTNQTFSWTATNNNTGDANATSGTNVTSIDVAGNNFNGELITITFNLPTTYSPPSDNDWWQIAYAFDTDVHDRTTWSVNIVGDPVHLVG